MDAEQGAGRFHGGIDTPTRKEAVKSILRKASARLRKPAAHISGRFEPGKEIGLIQKNPARFADAA
jgi:hypothetical protein